MMSYASNVIFMLRGDVAGGSICDSACGRTITNVSVVVSAIASAYGGGAWYFNGLSTTMLRWPNQASIEFWVSNYTLDFRMRNDPTYSMATIRFLTIGSNNYRYHLMLKSSGWTYYQESVTVANSITFAYDWGAHTTLTHFAFVQEGSTLRVFASGGIIYSGALTLCSNLGANNTYSFATLGTLQYATGVSAFKGWIEEFRITQGVALWTTNFVPPEGPLLETVYTPPSQGLNSDVVLLLHCDGAEGGTVFIDSAKGKTNTVTNATTVSALAKSNQGMRISYPNMHLLSFAPHSDFFWASDFTVDFWIKYSALPGTASTGGGAFLAKWASANMRDNFGQYIAAGNSLDLRYQYWSYGVAVAYLVANVGVISTNINYHIAMTRSGSAWHFFVNGVSQIFSANYYTSGSAGMNLSTIAAQCTAAHIGDRGDSTTNWAAIATMDEIRIVKGVALWVDDFTPPTPPYTQELPVATIALNASNVQPLWIENQGLQIANRFRYDAVRKIPDMSAAQVRAVLMSAGYAFDADNDHDFTSIEAHSINSVRLYPTITEDDNSDVASIYLSDVPWAGSASTVGMIFTVAKDFISGGSYDAYTNLLLLGEDSIATTFTDQTGLNTVTRRGAAVNVSTVFMVGSNAIAMLTGSDALSFPFHSRLQFSNGDFTIHFYALVNQSTSQWSVAGAQRFYGQYINESNRWHININSNAFTAYVYSAGVLSLASTFSVMTSWGSTSFHHFAITKGGSIVRCYVDGAVCVSLVGWEDWFAQSAAITFGAYDNAIQWFRGYLDQLTVIKGIAVWSAAFTPPTLNSYHIAAWSGETIVGFLSINTTIPEGETLVAKGVSLRLT